MVMILKRRHIEYIEHRWKQVTGHMVDANFNYLKKIGPETYEKVQKEIVNKYFGAIDYYIYKEVRTFYIGSIGIDKETGKRKINISEKAEFDIIPATPDPKFLYEKSMRGSPGDTITIRKFTIDETDVRKDVKYSEHNNDIIFEKELSSNPDSGTGSYKIKWETHDEMVFEGHSGTWIILTRKDFAIDSKIIIMYHKNIEVKLVPKMPYEEKDEPDNEEIGETPICKNLWHNPGVGFPNTTVMISIQDKQEKEDDRKNG